MMVSALSLLNSGDIDFCELHTFDEEHEPCFHPNLVILYSRALESGVMNFLTQQQESLLLRYIYEYDENDVLLKALDGYLGSIENEGLL